MTDKTVFWLALFYYMYMFFLLHIKFQLCPVLVYLEDRFYARELA